jgi:membrane peptidoglycan carboxypeptidase
VRSWLKYTFLASCWVRTFSRKLTELAYSYQLEKKYSKDEILEGYLNTIYFNNGVYASSVSFRLKVRSWLKYTFLASCWVMVLAP